MHRHCNYRNSLRPSQLPEHSTQMAAQVTEALQAGGQPVKGSTGNNGWAHYRLQLPAGSGPTQLRVELLQPGRTSFGARLYVATGPVDCARRASGFAMRGTRPERCVESACEVDHPNLPPLSAAPPHFPLARFLHPLSSPMAPLAPIIGDRVGGHP